MSYIVFSTICLPGVFCKSQHNIYVQEATTTTKTEGVANNRNRELKNPSAFSLRRHCSPYPASKALPLFRGWPAEESRWRLCATRPSLGGAGTLIEGDYCLSPTGKTSFLACLDREVGPPRKPSRTMLGSHNSPSPPLSHARFH